MRIPDSYAQTPLGQLMIADGANPMKIWDGLKPAPIDAGLAKPTTSLTLAAGLTAGPIFGAYAAYTRFLDEDGNVSSLSPISTFVQVEKAGGNVTNATYTHPIEITTDAPHDLSDGDIVLIEFVQGTNSANGSWEVTVTGANTFTLDGSDGDDVYIPGTGVWKSGVDEIVYSDVPVPTSSKAVRKQILRNTDGQASVFYVDVDTTDVAGTGFTSDFTDSELAARTAVPLQTENGAILADAHDPPPNYKCVIVNHLARMFAMVDLEYEDGAVKVTNGSTLVEGIGTAWTAAFANRFLYVTDASKEYQIESVDVDAQVLTLTEAYDDASAPYAIYGIAPPPGERRIVNYTPATEPQSWSPLYGLEVQEDGDKFTGGMQKGSFLYILEREHIYRLTFQSDPAVDGFVYLSCMRGCINNRCWVQVEDATFMLDRAGIHAFDGGQGSQPLSTTIQLIFQTLEESEYIINWNAAPLFHAAHFPQEEVVRWFVSMASNLTTRHAITMHYRTKRWWLEEYPRPITASALGLVGTMRMVFLGSESAKMITASVGHLDGIDKNAGTLVGPVTSADLASITDNTAIFPAGVVGLSVTITGGKGKMQTRIIHTVSGGRLSVTVPWTIIPDTTSSYQIAGIVYRFASQQFQWSPAESESPRSLGVYFQPSEQPANVFIRQFRDCDTEPVVFRTDTFGRTGEGVCAQEGSSYLTLDMTEPLGYAQQRMDGHRDENIAGNRQWTFEITGAGGNDGATFFTFVVGGVAK